MTYDDVFEDLTYNRGAMTSTQILVRTTAWFILNLQESHQIPNEVIRKMIGIGEWYMQKGFLTERQSNWLQLHLVRYQESIDPMKAYA